MSAANNPPYRTEALDAVFTGGQRETARFKSIYYRTDRDTEKRTIRLIGTGPLYSLPRSGGTDAAMAHVRIGDHGGRGRTSVEQLALLVRSRGSSTWRAAALMEVPYADQLPARHPPRAPTAAEEAATDLVGRVIAYVEKGTMPEGVTWDSPHSMPVGRSNARTGSRARVVDYKGWSLSGTGRPGGPGAPITVVGRRRNPRCRATGFGRSRKEFGAHRAARGRPTSSSQTAPRRPASDPRRATIAFVIPAAARRR